MVDGPDFSDFEIHTTTADSLTDGERAAIFALFDGSYRQANRAYLEKSLARLQSIAIAMRDGAPAGFAVGTMRVVDLPRRPRQAVLMAGICCIDAEFRRRHLFRELERRAIAASGVLATGRVLTCGRMAHPASFRLMTANPSHVPKPGVTPTQWQQDVGSAIAEAYGVHGFDPRTFVCIGAGQPIGYPIMDVDVTAGEWEVFREVDRDRGDSLLGMAWMPDAPDGW